MGSPRYPRPIRYHVTKTSLRAVVAVCALSGALGLGAAPAPADEQSAPSDPSAALAEATTRLSDAHTRLDAAEAQLATVTTQLETLDAAIADLGPRRSAQVDLYAQTRQDLVDAAVAAYMGGGRLEDPVISAAGSSTMNDYMVRRNMVGFATDQLGDTAQEHWLAAEALDEQLAGLGAERSALAASAAVALREVEQRTAEFAEAARTLDLAEDTAAAAPGSPGTGGIPPRALEAYNAAANRVAAEQPACRISWWVLAAIGKVESGHGAGRLAIDGTVSPHVLGPLLDGGGVAAIPDTDGGVLDGDTRWDRAVGPMQFIPSTWQGAVGDGVADPHDIDDASLAAARYLCRGGRGVPLDTERGLRAAAFSYNRSSTYVDRIVELAVRYATRPELASTDSAPAGGATAPRFVVVGLGIGPDWGLTTALVDGIPGRTITDSAATMLARAAWLPHGSTLIVVASPSEGADIVTPAAAGLTSGLLGRRIRIIMTTPDPVQRDAVRSALTRWPDAGVVDGPSVAAAWGPAEDPATAPAALGLAALINTVG